MPTHLRPALGLISKCSPLIFLCFLTALSSTVLANEETKFQASGTESAARGFSSIKRSLVGTTKTVQIEDGSALVNDLVTLSSADTMYLRKVYITNGNFIVVNQINRGVITIELPSGIRHDFYLDKFERQEHTFDPPILIESGTAIRTFFNTQSNGGLSITLLGSTDPNVFQDRFESPRLR